MLIGSFQLFMGNLPAPSTYAGSQGGWHSVVGSEHVISPLQNVADLVPWFFILYDDQDMAYFNPKLVPISYPLGVCMRSKSRKYKL